MYPPLEKSSRVSQLQRHRRAFALSALACTFLLLILARFRQDFSPTSLSTGSISSRPSRRNVAIASHFSQHFDVHLAAAHTIRQVLGHHGTIQVFANTPLLHGFQDVVDALDLYDQPIQRPEEFIDEMKSSAGESESAIDLVLFGTCEVE